MIYEIYKVENELCDEKVERTILTIQATYEDGSTSLHGFPLEEGETVKEAAVRCASQLDKVLGEQKIVTTQDVPVLEQDKLIPLNEIRNYTGDITIDSELPSDKAVSGDVPNN